MRKESEKLSFLSPVQALTLMAALGASSALGMQRLRVCAPGVALRLADTTVCPGFHCLPAARLQPRHSSSLWESDQVRHRSSVHPPSSHEKAPSEKNSSKPHSNPEGDWEALTVIVWFRCYLGILESSPLSHFWFFTWFSLEGSCAKLLIEKM